MNFHIRQKALEKLAFYGSAFVPGAPSYSTPSPTVGQLLYSLNSNTNYNTHNSTSNVYVNNAVQTMPMTVTPFQRREISDKIVGTGLDVNAPVKSLLRAGVGALAGNFIANTLRTGPFVRGLMTAAGANYGYNH